MGNRSLTLNYAHYEVQTVLHHGIRFEGYPLENIQSPSTMTDIDDVRKLRDALRSTTCHWVKLRAKEKEALQARLKAEAQVNGRDTIKPVRAPRKDAGVKRGPNARTANKDSANGTKKRPLTNPGEEHSTKRPRGPSSAETVPDEEDSMLTPTTIRDEIAVAELATVAVSVG